jgi:uncharacterized SAM-binding protein YcdF (DUF218 family)
LVQITEIIAAEIVYARASIDLTDGPLDAVIVLGGPWDPDLHLSYVTRRRATVAASMLKAGTAEHAIFSGRGAPPWIEPVAVLMRAQAIAEGAPAARMLIEPEAGSTLGNLVHSFAITDACGFRRVALLSHAAHLPRAWALAAWLGRPQTVLVAADRRPRLWSFATPGHHAREAMAWIWNLGKAVSIELGLRVPPQAGQAACPLSAGPPAPPRTMPG